MAYAEKRDGKLTGFWYGEVVLKASHARYRRRFETKREAAGYEAYVKATGFEPVNLKDAKLGVTFSQVAGSLTVDKGLSGDSLQTFVLSMASIKPSDIAFYTVPWKPRGDGENVVWITSKADDMWNAMIHETAYPPASSATPKPSSSSTTSSNSSSSTAKAACFG